VLQLISLAGIHSTAAITNELSKLFKDDGMLAYVNLVQRREKELGCDVLTHQKLSGAALVDGMIGVIQSGSSGSKSMGEGNTEASKCPFEQSIFKSTSVLIVLTCGCSTRFLVMRQNSSIKDRRFLEGIRFRERKTLSGIRILSYDYRLRQSMPSEAGNCILSAPEIV
jgi:hypothetical protein